MQIYVHIFFMSFLVSFILTIRFPRKKLCLHFFKIPFCIVALYRMSTLSVDDTDSLLFAIVGNISHIFSSLEDFQTHVPAPVWPQRALHDLHLWFYLVQ